MLLLMYSSPNVSSNILLNHVSNVTIVSLSTFRKLYDNSTTKTTIALLNKTALSVFTEASSSNNINTGTYEHSDYIINIFGYINQEEFI